MITFTEEDKGLRAMLEGMQFTDAKIHFQQNGYDVQTGCFKWVFIHPDRNYVVKICCFDPAVKGATPYQTVRRIDGYDEKDGDTLSYRRSSREQFREVFGINTLKKYRVKDYFFGQGEDFIFIFQEKVTPLRRVPKCENREAELNEKRVAIRRVVDTKIKKTFSGYYADLHDGNWGVSERGELLLYDGA